MKLLLKVANLLRTSRPLDGLFRFIDTSSNGEHPMLTNTAFHLPLAFLAAMAIFAAQANLNPPNAYAEESGAKSVWFGTTGNNAGAEAGIYHSSIENGKLTKAELAIPLRGAGWITKHPTINDVIYATASLDKSSVVAIRDGKLISTQEVQGGSCFLTTDHTGTLLLSAHYGDGSVSVIPINADGSLGDEVQRIQHQGGSKVVPGRQKSPHPHYVSVSPDNRFAFVPDLGLDQLVKYRLDLEAKKLSPAGTVDVEPGGGPRHMKFHPGGKYAFVVNEMTLALTVFGYDGENGTMTKLATVPTLTEEEKNQNKFNSGSEIRVSQSGDFVYSANRGHDSISVFSFDANTGTLKRIQIAPARAAWPRNFNLSPCGGYLMAAGRDTNNISLFSIGADGKLTHLEHKSIFVPGPICVLIDE